MSTFLSPAQYNHAEQKGLESLCGRAIECFRPSTFAAVGYPFSISSMSELWRYTECMHEGIGLPQPMSEYLMATLLVGGFTEQEIEEARHIKRALDDLSRSIGRPVEYPVYSMIRAFNQARHIGCLAAPGSTVVELGGGAGYLGALLVLRGYRYVATDVAQALYILQSNLLARLSAGGVVDLVDTQYGAGDLGTLKPGQAGMVPWWRWAQRSTLAELAIDLATTNHNLLEMHPRSRLYHLAAVRERLSPQGNGFVFEGWGAPHLHPQWTAVKDFSDHGYVLAHNDIRIHCFAPKERHAEGTVLRYPLAAEAAKQPEPVHAAGGAGTPPQPTVAGNGAGNSAAPFRERARRWLLNRAFGSAVDARMDARMNARMDAWSAAIETPLRAQMTEISARLDRMEPTVNLNAQWISRTEHALHQNEREFAAPNFSDERNPISRTILAMRAQEKAKARFTMQDYKNCFGIDEVWTEDDRFLAYVYRGTPLGLPWVTTLPK